MSAPLLWIALPLGAAFLLLFISNERLTAALGGSLCLVLAALALLFPTDTAQRVFFGLFSIRIDSTLTLMGRQIQLTPANQIILALAYGLGAFWFFGALALKTNRRLVPLGIAVLALLVASLAVKPFLYAAPLIEMAVLLSLPILVPSGKTPGQGTLRFFNYQSLAMPFILLAGFMLEGIDAGPRDFGLVQSGALILGIGFAFLLAIFPLSVWMPMLMEETPPYLAGFLLAVFPTFHLLFGLNFVDRYAWMRESPAFFTFIRLVGLSALIPAGFLALFERHLGRVLGYFVSAEIGISLIALSLTNHLTGLQIILGLIIPRTLALGLWALSLATLGKEKPTLELSALQGAARSFPLASAGIVVSMLALSGVPLLAIFPLNQALWEALAAESPLSAALMGLAMAGLWGVSLRALAVLNLHAPATPWSSLETWPQRVLSIAGLTTLFILGLFPQWLEPVLANLPGMFERLAGR